MRKLFLAVSLCSGLAAAGRTWDPNKPFIYEMKIAFEMDNWTNMYSTATVLSKSDNTVAFRVVANSTTSPTYQLVVTTQGNVGIATASPAGLFTVGNGALTVLSTGRVGIGTASPASIFQIRGTSPHLSIYDSGTSFAYASFNSNSGAYGRVGMEPAGGGTLLVNAPGYATVLGSISAHALALGVGGYTKMLIDASGNVGIGTTTPGAKLQVSGGDITITTGNSATVRLQLQGNDSNGTGYIGNPTAYPLQFFTGGIANPKMTILSGGYVGIGTTAPGHLLHLSGGAYCDGTGGWVSGSDRAYKKDIDYDFKYGLKEIEQLKPVYYIHKQDKENKKQIGFIAQDVKKIIPEVVGGSEGSLGLSYEQLNAVLVKAVQEQQQEIEELKAKNERLETRLKALEKSR